MKLPAPGSSTPRLNAISSAARTAVKNSSLAADDETGLWEFATRLSGSDDYRQLVPLAPATSDQQSRMTVALQALRATDQDTGLYDTISAGVRALRDQARTATKLAPVNRLVVLTDGENDDEDTDAATLPKLGALLRTAGVEVAVIATVGANCNALESLREFKLTCVEAESDGLAAAFGNALPSRAAKPSS